MAATDFTSSDNAATASQMEEGFSITASPFAVWEGAKWAINDERGVAIAEAENHEDAVKISNALRVGTNRGTAETINKAAEYRAGAMACLDAMQIIQCIDLNMCGLDNSEDIAVMFERNKNAGVTAMLHAAGVRDGFMAGFVAAFAEYVMTVERAGTPDPYMWKPDAAMTMGEKILRRAERAKRDEEIAA